jgi:exopolysaccharide production protein ExoQ
MNDVYAGAWRGIFDHKNGLGRVMALGLITILWVRARGSQWIRAALIFGFVLCTVELVGSRSATAAGIAVVGLTLVVLLRSPRRGPALAAIAGVSLVGAALLGAAVFGGAIDAGDLLAVLGRDESLTGRTEIWSSVMQAISDRPFFGFGYDVFWQHFAWYGQYIPPSIGWRPFHAHNGYLEAALDFGLSGLGIAIALLLSGATHAWRFAMKAAPEHSGWSLLVILYFVATNFTESVIGKYNSPDWIVLIVAILFAYRGSRAQDVITESDGGARFRPTSAVASGYAQHAARSTRQDA